MTLLRTIIHNHLSLTCKACNHTGLIAVIDLLDSVAASTTVDQVVAKARCGKCRSKNVGEMRILYVGHSTAALEGARAIKGPTEID